MLTVLPLSGGKVSGNGGEGSSISVYLPDATVCYSVKLVQHRVHFSGWAKPESCRFN